MIKFFKIIKLMLLPIVFFGALVSIKKIKNPEVVLPIPLLSKENILGCKAGVRPYRTTGIRIEPEYFKEKLIIHDYGHGGSGISLSWGSAHLSVSLLNNELSNGFKVKDHEIAVIGSGIIGLSTAHLLADRGWNVHIYADQFPPHTTSDVAPGLWNKVLVGEGLSESQKKMTDKILHHSFKEFHHLSLDPHPEFQGVSPLLIYTFKPNPPLKDLLKELHLDVSSVNAAFGEKKIKGLRLQSMLIDTSVYLPDLVAKAKKKGIAFTQQTFHTKEDLLDLPQKVIFNCTGMGSKELFHDDQLIPVKGELIELKQQKDLNMMIAGPMKDNIDLYFIPIHDKLILGGSYEYASDDENPNPLICEQILQHAREYFSPSINQH